MSYHDQLVTEINVKLDALAGEKKPWEPRWVAHAILGDHDEAGLKKKLPRHHDFWSFCGYAETRREATRVINKRAGIRDETEDREPVFPGFERLQRYYVVKRNGEEIGVAIEDLTDAELESKAAEYRSQADGCNRHANELDRYRRLRKSAA